MGMFEPFKPLIFISYKSLSFDKSNVYDYCSHREKPSTNIVSNTDRKIVITKGNALANIGRLEIKMGIRF